MPSQNNPRYAGINYSDPRVIAAYKKLGEQSKASGGSTADKLQKALDDANAANAARRDEINQSYLTLASQQGGFGNAAKTDISRIYGDRAGDIQQSTVSRGLSGTTVLPNLLAGNARDQAQEMSRVDESVALNAQNIEMARLAFQERINELGPDIMSLLPLLQQSGQASISMPTYRSGGGVTTASRRSTPSSNTSQRNPLDMLNIYNQTKKTSPVLPGQTSIYQMGALAPKSTSARPSHEYAHAFSL